jgi:hypothetical protein
MRKKHLIPFSIVVLTGLFLLFATQLVNREEESEGSGFVQVGDRLVNGGMETASVSHECFNSGKCADTEDTDFSVKSESVSADNTHDNVPALNWIGDTLRIADIIRNEGSQGEPDLSVLKVDYLTADNGTTMLLAQNQLSGIYLIQKSASQEMVLMNYFENAMQVTFQEESTLGMPNIITTNANMTLGYYVWDGTSYKLDHEGRWMCPA